jgi:ribA/ribD-fused uncharacterized protein
MNDHDVNSPTYWRNREDGRNPVRTILGPQPIDHASAMAQQDPAFPDYDERGWPSELVCAVNELREHAARVMEIAAALRTTNALRAGSLHAIATSLEFAAAPAERYMQENAGPGLGMQIVGTVEGTREPGFVKPDTDTQVFFYEQDFYVLSNFSAFRIKFEDKATPAGSWSYRWFDTSEQCYHFQKFDHLAGRGVQALIMLAESAHDAFKIAQEHIALRRPDWDRIKVDVMGRILRAKVNQHAYVRRKLLATGDRELIEDSWRDDFWGWGPNRDGQNMLGKLWMQVRDEIRGAA